MDAGRRINRSNEQRPCAPVSGGLALSDAGFTGRVPSGAAVGDLYHWPPLRRARSDAPYQWLPWVGLAVPCEPRIVVAVRTWFVVVHIAAGSSVP